MENLGLVSSFWAGKRVFLTGHTGFKGSWLALWLSMMDAEVLGYALAPDTEPNLFDLAEVKRDVTSVIADVRDYKRLEECLKNFQPEIVIHMAAQPLVRKSYREPLETLDINVMGTANLFQAARGVESVRAILNVTSDKCYYNREWEWGYREDEAMGGFDPYSVSKGCSELVTTAFRHSFYHAAAFDSHRVVLASARSGNVFGGGDWSEDRLIPDVIRAIAAHDTVQIRYPDAVRPWQFVLEPLRGYLLLLEHMVTKGISFAEGWNFGTRPTDEVPVRVVLNELKNIFGDELKWSTDQEQQLHEANLLRLDTTKARTRLGWQPAWDLRRGLKETALWYKTVLAKPAQTRTYSLELLEKYCETTSMPALEEKRSYIN
ncbi:MAG: CDP-glucose 4,6-dehydratase [Bdellovibrionales bacterium]|nr:CDP-glucose 4,6-dehydratase [Bdellovibrionales bacterium]